MSWMRSPWLPGGLAAMMAAGVAAVALHARRPQGRPREASLPQGYVGADACGRCHPEIHRLQRTSAHSRTLAGAESALSLPLPSPWIRDPVAPMLFRIARRDGTLGVEVQAGEIRRWQPGHWAFGSGQHGLTLVAGAGAGRYLELPLSYYPGYGWDFTPGFLMFAPQRRMFHPAGVPADHTMFLQCFDCHATGVRPGTPGSNDMDLSGMRAGVLCERCHGPGEDHVRAVEAGRPAAGTIRNPGRGSPQSISRFCGECHRSEAPPGIKPEAPGLARYAPVGLQRSRCYRESRLRAARPLSCLSCHDPHQDARRGPEHVEAICRSCHGAAPEGGQMGTSVCPVNPRTGCVRCHMPKVEAARHSFFTDHWIRPHRAPPTLPRDSGVSQPQGADPFGH